MPLFLLNQTQPHPEHSVEMGFGIQKLQKEKITVLFFGYPQLFHRMDPTHIDLCILDLLFLSQVSLQRWGMAIPCFLRAEGGACCICKQTHRNQSNPFPAANKDYLLHIRKN